MPSDTADSVRDTIFKGLEGVKGSIEYILTFPRARRVDARELHLAATLWCSRMRDMPSDASDDSEEIRAYLQRVALSNKRAGREGPVDTQQIEGGILLYENFHEYVCGILEPEPASPRNVRHQLITTACESLRAMLHYPEAPTDFVPALSLTRNS